MKRWLAGKLRTWADWLDFAGAPKRTQWSFTIEDQWGALVNESGQGCRLWYYGDQDYQKAHTTRTVPAKLDDIQWVTVGLQTPDGVHVLGSAEVVDAATTRTQVGHDLVKVPGARRDAHVPRWEITLVCKMGSFVSVSGGSYPDALRKMLQRGGVRG